MMEASVDAKEQRTEEAIEDVEPAAAVDVEPAAAVDADATVATAIKNDKDAAVEVRVGTHGDRDQGSGSLRLDRRAAQGSRGVCHGSHDPDATPGLQGECSLTN